MFAVTVERNTSPRRDRVGRLSGMSARHALAEPAAAEFDFERPWTRQPFDTDNRWRAFVAYRESPLPRSIRRTSEILADPMTGEPFDVRTLERWSSENAWPERVAEFDRYLDAQRVAATVAVLNEDARTTAAFHADLLRKAQHAAASVVNDWLERLARGERLDGWSPGDVRGLLKDTITLERLVRGQATERVEHGVLDLSALTIDEIETLRALEAKAGVVD